MAGLSLPGIAAAVPQGFAPLQAAQVFSEEAKPTPEGTPMGRLALDYELKEPVTHSDEQSSERIFASGLTPEPGATPPALSLEPLFTVYQVRPGDTVGSIAAQFGLQPDSIIWNNVEISDEDFLAEGQLLRVPATDGVIHEVRLGDTLGDVAARYGVELSAITTFSSNGIAAPDDVQERQLVFVPGGTIAPPPAPEPEEAESAAPSGGDAAAEPAAAAPGAAPPPDFTPSAGLIWPTSGPISSYMGPGHPLGIDVDLYNNPSAPIQAATSGVVTFAGGDPCCSYGLYVVVVSPGGVETLYAHLSSINVVQGQQVSQGDVLGSAGCTGYCTGNHLHFEVIDNGVREDPLEYLP